MISFSFLLKPYLFSSLHLQRKNVAADVMLQKDRALMEKEEEVCKTILFDHHRAEKQQSLE